MDAEYLTPALYADAMADGAASTELFPAPLALDTFSSSELDSYFSFDSSPAPSPSASHTPTILPPTPLSRPSPVKRTAVKDEAELGETRAAKRSRGLALIDVPTAAESAPTSPFSVSASSRSVSPVPSLSPSLSSSATMSPTPSPSPPPTTINELLAESALKRSRLARKAELARLGRKRKNETIDKFADQVERLEKELRAAKAALEKERKAHRRTTRLLAEKVGGGVGGAAVAEVGKAVPAVVKVAEEAVVEGPGRNGDKLAVCQGMLTALAVFCRERGLTSAAADSASALLVSHIRTLLAVESASAAEWVKAVQAAVVDGDANAGLLARFVLWWMAQPPRADAQPVTQGQLDALASLFKPRSG